MNIRLFAAVAALSSLGALPAFAQAEIVADPAFPCDTPFCQSYNEAAAPFKIFGETFYVGTTRLATLLINTGQGLILVDGGFPGAAPVIAENIRALGFDPADIVLLVNSHTHIDHVGSLAAFQQATGARVLASGPARAAMLAGHATPDDPQYRESDTPDFPPLTNVDEIADGESVRIGDTELTAVYTPGHTPGGTSWTWQECEGDVCFTVVYADSLNPISNDVFRYSDNPDYLETFRNSMAVTATLECDIPVSPHPEFVRLFEKQALMNEDGANPFVDTLGCARYALQYAETLGQRLATEQAAAAE